MKNMCLCFIMLLVFIPKAGLPDILGNPGTQVGKKNLFVGIEYSSSTHVYNLDTKDLNTSSERIALKVTTGLSEWMDIYIKGGGANLLLDYKGKDIEATKNFDTDFGAGFGAGGRIRLFNFVDSGTRIFLQGGGFYFKVSDNIVWDRYDGSIDTKERDIKWVDLYAGLGISKRFEYIDLTFGVGFSNIWWELNDVDLTKSGTSVSRIPRSKRDSFETVNPVFGFIGLDFVLPHEYRISAQAGIRNVDEAEFSIALSQGIERD